MASAQSIGKVKAGKTKKSIEVFWNSYNGEVYVGWAGKSRVPGKASSASQAANMAEVWLRDK